MTFGLFLVQSLFIILFFAAKLRDVEVLCQENEGVGGDLVKKVRIFRNILHCTVFNETLSRSWIFSTKQRMDSPFPTRTIVLLLLKKKKNTRNDFTQRWKISTNCIF